MNTYKSRVGIEMKIILLLMCLFNLYILITEGFHFFLLILMFSPIVFIIYVINATNYEIKDEVLYIKSSFFFREELPINKIRKIDEVINIINSPAMSIKRLELFYGKYDSIMISPKHQEQFISELLSVNNNIEIKLKK